MVFLAVFGCCEGGFGVVRWGDVMSVIFSVDGKVVDWGGSAAVTKIVVGTPPGKRNEAKPTELSVALPDDFAKRYPALTHLYLWQISNLTELPQLPAGLRCLDVRGCGELKRLAALPHRLVTLVIEGAANLSSLPTSDAVFDELRDLSLKDCTGLDETVFQNLLARCPALQRLDLSNTLVNSLPQSWPSGLRDVRLNNCNRLRRIKQAWPATLTHLELRGAKKLEIIPVLPPKADYVDLAYTQSLLQLPEFPWESKPDLIAVPRVPRTLFLFQTGVKLERDLYGEEDDTNVSDRVRADLQASAEGRLADCELKVILLGNGRCGKSSLARVWKYGVEDFDQMEKTTHGVRVWEKPIDFKPQDNLSPGDDNDGKALLKIWDFAGQDVYHSTHQLFLQSRAIFLICHNDHFDCPGADPATDEFELHERAGEGVDIPRTLEYWKEQVAALGYVPGTTIKPPVLIVRTKSDRWVSEKTADEVCFSAKTGDGLKEIEEWVEKQVSMLLGTWPQRSLPKSVVEVKKKILPRIEENEKHYWQAEASPAASGSAAHVAQSPFPFLSKQDFNEIVQECCSGDYKDSDSRLLLERFHRSGFIYHDPRYLPDHVILDQRWALQGIYTFCSRDSQFQIRKLMSHKKGQFTKSLLKEKSWGPAGYNDLAMELFLKFMKACGMCFEILSARDTTANEAVYAIPGFLSSRSSAAREYPEINDQSGSHQRYIVQDVSESDIRGVISRFGRDWRRSMYAWQWGCRVRSAASDAVCFLDWCSPESGGGYRYPLTVRFFGPDEPGFRGLVAEYLREVLHKPVGIPDASTIAPWVTQDIFREEFMPPRDGAEAKSGVGPNDRRNHVPSAEKTKGVRVALSFANADKDNPRLADIPLAVARELNQRLKQVELGSVLCYIRDTNTPQMLPEEERFDQFTNDLARGDIILVFWSNRYWHSKFCMAEMMLIYNRVPAGRLLDKEVLTYVFDKARFSESDGVDVNVWEKSWVDRMTERINIIRDLYNGNIRDETAALKRDGIVHDWYEFVGNRQAFTPFIEALKGYRLGFPLSVPNSAEEVEKAAAGIVETVMSLLRNPLELIEQAIRAFQSGSTEHAVMFLRRAFQLTPHSNEGFEALLNGPTGEKIPAELRQAALSYVRQRDFS